MQFDGSKLLHGSGAGVTLKSLKGDELSYVLQIHFPTTNNIAEYEALLYGLRVTKEISVQYIMCCGDSDLVAQQVAGIYKAQNEIMAAYRDEVDEMAKSFLSYDIRHVRQEDNMAADTLSKLGSSHKAVPLGVFLEHLCVPLVKMVDEVYPRQCPYQRAFDLGSVLGTWQTRRRSDESRGTQEFTQVQPPRKVKGLRPACLTLY
jgi:ribonuclease HI